MGKQPRALLALSLSGDEEALLNYAINFCEKTHMELEVCHVVQEFSPYVHEGAYFPETLIPEDMRFSAKEDAQKKLATLMASRDSGVISSWYIKVGWLENCIYDTIQRNNIDLLITGKEDDYHSFFRRMTSNLVGLSKSSPIPILMVPKTYRRLLPESPNIMVADSLSGKTSKALHSAFDLAFLMSKTTLHHVYVCDELRNNLDRVPPEAFDRIFNSLRESGGDNDEFHRLVGEHLKGRMTERCSDRADLKNVGGDYKNVLLFGRASEQLPKFLRKEEIDIMVTGGHFKSLLQGVLYRDQMPFEDQVSIDLPIFMVPQTLEEDHAFSLVA